MSYHMDKGVNSAIIRLLDELCEWERNSGRRTTLVLIPHKMEEQMLVAQDGKPLQLVTHSSLLQALTLAMNERSKTWSEGLH